MPSLESLRGYWWLIVWGLLLATNAPAQQLRLGAVFQSVYNSNFFSSATNENEAVSLQIGPSVQLIDPDGRLRYDLSYSGAYQGYIDESGVDAWESRLRARATYDIDRRTRVRVTERFRDVSNLRFSRQDIASADTALDPNQDRYFRNELELEFIRDLSRYLALDVRAAHHWIDFSKNFDRNDSQAFEVGTELRYQIAPRHRLGVGASYTNQDFEPALSRLGSRGEYLTGQLSWTLDLADNIELSLNGGPTWIRSKEDNTNEVSQDRFVGGRSNGELARADLLSCDVDQDAPGGPSRVASNCDFASFDPIAADDLGPREAFALATGERVVKATELTFFGGASVRASFAEWNLESSYSRRQSTTSGDGLASSLDRVALEVEYAPPARRWSVFVAANWNRRKTLTDATLVDFTVIAGPDGEAQRDIAFTSVESRRSRRDSFTAIVGCRSDFARGQSGTLEFRYRRTESRDGGITRPQIDTFFLLLSLDYTHDLIRL